MGEGRGWTVNGYAINVSRTTEVAHFSKIKYILYMRAIQWFLWNGYGFSIESKPKRSIYLYVYGLQKVIKYRRYHYNWWRIMWCGLCTVFENLIYYIITTYIYCLCTVHGAWVWFLVLLSFESFFKKNKCVWSFTLDAQSQRPLVVGITNDRPFSDLSLVDILLHHRSFLSNITYWDSKYH